MGSRGGMDGGSGMGGRVNMGGAVGMSGVDTMAAGIGACVGTEGEKCEWDCEGSVAEEGHRWWWLRC